jgi:hypothetical protein
LVDRPGEHVETLGRAIFGKPKDDGDGEPLAA